jgi:hypothetical protein
VEDTSAKLKEGALVKQGEENIYLLKRKKEISSESKNV